jgi:hypothetical protein
MSATAHVPQHQRGRRQDGTLVGVLRTGGDDLGVVERKACFNGKPFS